MRSTFLAELQNNGRDDANLSTDEHIIATMAGAEEMETELEETGSVIASCTTNAVFDARIEERKKIKWARYEVDINESSTISSVPLKASTSTTSSVSVTYYDSVYFEGIIRFSGQHSESNTIPNWRGKTTLNGKYFSYIGKQYVGDDTAITITVTGHAIISYAITKKAKLLSAAKGSLIDYVTGEEGDYPDDGPQGRYWYVKQ